MLISMIILWAVVVIEFILILFLLGSGYNQGKTIQEIVNFLDKYVDKATEQSGKVIDTLDDLAHRILEIYEWKEKVDDNQ